MVLCNVVLSAGNMEHRCNFVGILIQLKIALKTKDAIRGTQRYFKIVRVLLDVLKHSISSEKRKKKIELLKSRVE